MPYRVYCDLRGYIVGYASDRPVGAQGTFEGVKDDALDFFTASDRSVKAQGVFVHIPCFVQSFYLMLFYLFVKF